MGLKIAPLRVKDMHSNAETNKNTNPFEFTDAGNVAFQLLYSAQIIMMQVLANDLGWMFLTQTHSSTQQPTVTLEIH